MWGSECMEGFAGKWCKGVCILLFVCTRVEGIAYLKEISKSGARDGPQTGN